MHKKELIEFILNNECSKEKIDMFLSINKINFDIAYLNMLQILNYLCADYNLFITNSKLVYKLIDFIFLLNANYSITKENQKLSKILIKNILISFSTYKTITKDKEHYNLYLSKIKCINNYKDNFNNTNAFIEYIKLLIDKNDSYFNIKKLISSNPQCIYNNELFNYVYNKLAKQNINNNLTNYYIHLLEIFYCQMTPDNEKSKYLEKLYLIPKNIQKNIIGILYNTAKPQLTVEDLKDLYQIKQSVNYVNIKKQTEFNDSIWPFTIDSPSTLIKDDAISIRKTSGNFQVGIHITDVGGQIAYGSHEDQNCLINFKNKFKTVKLFDKYVEESFSLNHNQIRPVISVYLILDKNAKILDYYITHENIKSQKTIDSKTANKLIITPQDKFEQNLKTLYELCDTIREKEKRLKKKSEAYGDIITTELSILYNYIIAKIANESNIPFVYRINDQKEYLNIINEVIKNNLNPQMEKAISSLEIFSKYSHIPKPHEKLKKTIYSHSTTPIGRYPDIFNQYLLHTFYFKDKRYKINEKNIKRIIEQFNQRNEELKLYNYDLTLIKKKGYTPRA